ncbi:ankyrin repeat and KH domain-containing protein mask-like isoform X2 [Halichondria panicea]|uniref:ankyrin repeat and KH domain-containing protein mask-like isoform X2 n=2 Tax=Halichondria panicea TaxID=6063 RepID=UPI00312B3F43
MCHESEVSVGMPTSLVGSAAWDRGYKTPKHLYCCCNATLCNQERRSRIIFPIPNEHAHLYYKMAVHNKCVMKVKSLLACRACPNHQLYWSKKWGTRLPPLHRACCDGHLEIVKMLVTHLSGHGACRSTCFTDDGGGEANRAPLHWACSGGHIEVVQYLIKEVNSSTVNCSTDVRDDERQSPLDIAMDPDTLREREGCLDVALYLICRGCGSDKDKDNLLHAACWWGKLDIVKELVEQHKVDPEKLPVNEWKVDKREYMWSDEEGFDEEDEDEDELQLPLDKALGPDYHECDNEEGRVDVALYLINRGCGWSMHKEKLLCAASRCGKLGVVKELIEQHKVDPKKATDVMMARLLLTLLIGVITLKLLTTSNLYQTTIMSTCCGPMLAAQLL